MNIAVGEYNTSSILSVSDSWGFLKAPPLTLHLRSSYEAGRPAEGLEPKQPTRQNARADLPILQKRFMEIIITLF